jgi:hypothetical protein
MKLSIRHTMLLRPMAVGLVAALGLAGPLVAQEAVTGTFEGAIDAGGQEAEFTLVVQDGDDGLEGLFSLPAESMVNEPVSALSFDGAEIGFTVGAGGEDAVFVGSRDGNELSGTLTGPVPPGATWRATRVGDAQLVAAPSIEVTPTSLTLTAGETMQLAVETFDAEGNPVEPARLRYYVRGGRGLTVTDAGKVESPGGGEYTILVIAEVGESQLRQDVEAVVTWPAVTEVRLEGMPEAPQSGNSYRVHPVVLTEGGLVREDLHPTLRSSNPDVATVVSTGAVRAVSPGRATITAKVENVEQAWPITVRESRVASLSVTADREHARTGDVVHVTASALDDRGRPVEDAPIAYSVEAFPIDTLIAPPSAGEVDAEGAFVAEKPGAYVIHASSGRAGASVEVQVEGREVAEKIELMGQGAVSETHTSDLWVWEGTDGRDYAITGTWGAEGKAYFWDVTDPTNITKIDSVQVDARTVNDVKVSEDGRVAVISREGASNRRNGIVLFDVSDPHAVEKLSEFDEDLTGGVHNVFVYDNHVYAVNNGRRYDIINIEDPRNPRRVGRFELDAPGHSVHDVWVVDGIAYSSNWRYGVVLVDVGNGVAGGTPENPVQFASYAYPSGANHAAFPFRSESTGKFYVIAGDEIMPGFDPDKPSMTAGYLHFIDFTDPENPREVARYQVPEAGTHNLWVEGDRLYAAFYNGGLRVIDISGELKGDLYRQGREIASYRAYDPDGKVPNAPMTWGPQPHKGHVFFSEFNSGLWSVKLEPRRELVP